MSKLLYLVIQDLFTQDYNSNIKKEFVSFDHCQAIKNTLEEANQEAEAISYISPIEPLNALKDRLYLLNTYVIIEQLEDNGERTQVLSLEGLLTYNSSVVFKDLDDLNTMRTRHTLEEQIKELCEDDLKALIDAFIDANNWEHYQENTAENIARAFNNDPVKVCLEVADNNNYTLESPYFILDGYGHPKSLYNLLEAYDPSDLANWAKDYLYKFSFLDAEDLED